MPSNSWERFVVSMQLDDIYISSMKGFGSLASFSIALVTKPRSGCYIINTLGQWMKRPCPFIKGSGYWILLVIHFFCEIFHGSRKQWSPLVFGTQCICRWIARVFDWTITLFDLISCHLGIMLCQAVNLDQSEELGRPGAIVSNHVSYVDILYHMSASFPSFVAKVLKTYFCCSYHT